MTRLREAMASALWRDDLIPIAGEIALEYWEDDVAAILAAIEAAGFTVVPREEREKWQIEIAMLRSVIRLRMTHAEAESLIEECKP